MNPHHHYCEVHPDECFEQFHKPVEVPEPNTFILGVVALMIFALIGGRKRHGKR